MTDTLEPPARFGHSTPEPPQHPTSDAKIPMSDRLKSWLFNKPCPRRGLAHASAMVAEQNRIGHTRPAKEFSAVERTLRNSMEADVNKQIVEDTKTELEPTVATVRAKLQEHNTLVRAASGFEPLVPSPPAHRCGPLEPRGPAKSPPGPPVLPGIRCCATSTSPSGCSAASPQPWHASPTALAAVTVPSPTLASPWRPAAARAP